MTTGTVSSAVLLYSHGLADWPTRWLFTVDSQVHMGSRIDCWSSAPSRIDRFGRPSITAPTCTAVISTSLYGIRGIIFHDTRHLGRRTSSLSLLFRRLIDVCYHLTACISLGFNKSARTLGVLGVVGWHERFLSVQSTHAAIGGSVGAKQTSRR